MNTRVHKVLLILLLAALILRCVFLVFVIGWFAPPRGDEQDYHAIAANISAGHGFTVTGSSPTARRPPVFPLLLGALYKVFGPRLAVGRILQLILGVLLVYLVFRAAKQYFSEKTAIVAAFLTAFNPFLIFISGYLLTENLYMVLMLTFLMLLPSGNSLWVPLKRLLIGALILALLSLTRPTGFPFSLWIFAALLLFSRGPVYSRLVRLVVFVMVWAIPFIPWTIRNHAVFGESVVFTTHGGITFYQGNNEAVRDIPRYHGGSAPLSALPEYLRLEGLSEVERDREAWQLGKDFVEENKSDVPLLAARRFLRFWRFKSDVGLSGIKSGWWWNKNSSLGRLASSLDVGFTYAIVVVPLFLMGFIGYLRSFRSFFYLYGVVVVHTFIALVFHGSLRGRIPVEPVMAMFSSAALLFIIDRIRGVGRR